jgi:8-oxo-dGTP diphosphatase
MASRITEREQQLIKIMEQKIQKPKVGVGVMILRDGKVLFGKRKGSHGEGEYAFPGGHLEYMESFAECAKREVAEECGIEIENIRFQFLANVIKYAPKHYVHVGLLVDCQNGEPKVLEPDKSESWLWYDIDNLPSPIFEMCKLAIESYKNEKIYFDVSDIKN